MISKELVGAVLNTEVTQVSIDGNKIRYNEHYVINTSEFGDKCKEWIFDQGYDNVNSGYNAGVRSGRKMITCNIKKFSGFMKKNDLDFDADTEPEAIFKAAEWVLKEQS